MEDEIKGKGFVIKDRRTFDEKGEARKAEEQAAPPTPEQDSKEEPKPGRGPGQTEDRQEMPPVTFTDFIVSLSTSVIYHFGDIPDPVTRKAEKNLVAAKQTIDILGILEQKTKGNLDENEKRLMDAILFELRMRYVKEAEKP
jgi:hypothetical protein